MENKLEKIKVTDERYRLGFHVMAPAGWVNDPNGFCYFNGYYHIFYQHYPYGAEWGPMHWGHSRSKDLVNWEALPIALTPGDTEDKDGCFSGSAVVKDGRLYLIYTGHHYYDKNDPDNFWQTQNIAYSEDGIHFTKYEGNPVISEPPVDNSHHFRDPKVWEHDNQWYMVLGSQDKEQGLGRVIVYRSNDLKEWDYLGPIAKANGLLTEGFMWECPDVFKLNDTDVLLMSPQGIEKSGEKYRNLFQTGYVLGRLDYEDHRFERGAFKELDYGHDFYAAQTTETPDGRRILIGWMAMWESTMPEKEHGWAGALTIPREVRLKDNHLFMVPVRELKTLRLKELSRFKEELSVKKVISKNTQSFEMVLTFDFNQRAATTVQLEMLSGLGDQVISLAYDKETGKLELNRRGEDGERIGYIAPTEKLEIQAFVDKSSVEFFINEGEAVFTERYYCDDQPIVTVQSNDKLKISGELYELNHRAVSHLIKEEK